MARRVDFNFVAPETADAVLRGFGVNPDESPDTPKPAMMERVLGMRAANLNQAINATIAGAKDIDVRLMHALKPLREVLKAARSPRETVVFQLPESKKALEGHILAAREALLALEEILDQNDVGYSTDEGLD
jgi:hypothetical protein